MNKKAFIFINILLLFSSLSYAAPCPKQNCVAVVDAGSSGSRLHVYAFDIESSNPARIEEIFVKKIVPSLSSLPLEERVINDYLDKLFTSMPINDVPVYFYSTGGMRLLPKITQDKYYKLVNLWFENHKNLKLSYAKTISGREEGLFDWLAVNWQLGSITTSGGATVSVMDVGGASTQIAMPLKSTAGVDPKDLVIVNLYGKRFTLFIHSFLGLGQNLVIQQFLDDEACFPEGYVLSNHESAHGDFARCVNNLSLLVNSVHKVDGIIKNLIINNRPQTWFVLGGIKDMMQEAPYSLNFDRYTYEFLAQEAQNTACQNDWSKLSTNYPNQLYLYATCIVPAYYYALMVNGYGLGEQERINLLPNNFVSDWTLGVVLAYTEKTNYRLLLRLRKE